MAKKYYSTAQVHSVSTEDEEAFLKENPHAVPINVRLANRRNPKLHKAIAESEGKCVLYKGSLRVIVNTPYQAEKAVPYAGGEE